MQKINVDGEEEKNCSHPRDYPLANPWLQDLQDLQDHKSIFAKCLPFFSKSYPHTSWVAWKVSSTWRSTSPPPGRGRVQGCQEEVWPPQWNIPWKKRRGLRERADMEDFTWRAPCSWSSRAPLPPAPGLVSPQKSCSPWEQIVHCLKQYKQEGSFQYNYTHTEGFISI